MRRLGGALLSLCCLSLCLGLPAPAECAEDGDVQATYHRLCASCHGTARYGGYGPPLIPSLLKRKTDDALAATILDGRPNTQMPAFGSVLDRGRADALVAFVRQPVGRIDWDLDDIRRSRIEPPSKGRRIPEKTRRENVILVVERGRGSISVLDGDSLRELDRFGVGRIHGGPKFDRSFRKVFAATRDGTLTEYDLEWGGVRARVKVAVNTRNIAASAEGDLVAAANLLPAGVVLLDGSLNPLRHVPLPGQPSGIYPLPGQKRFLLTLRDAPALVWIDHEDLSVRTVELREPFEDFVLVPGRAQMLASSRAGRRILLYDLERETVLNTLETEALPHLFSACFFTRDGVLYAALNHVGVPRLTILRMDTFRVEKTLSLRGSGYFVRTHPGTPFLWADTNTEEIQLVDKRSLELLDRGIVPESGKKAMHVEFTADGGRALVSVWHEDGAVVVYDSTNLAEVARLPYSMPIGKYNAFNKTRWMR